MPNGIPDYKTMRKLAKRHMEDHEPDRWKKKHTDLLLVIVSVLVVDAGAILWLNFWLWDNTYELALSVAMVVLAFGMMFIGLYIYFYFGLRDMNFHWVDYYFENVHQKAEGVE